MALRGLTSPPGPAILFLVAVLRPRVEGIASRRTALKSVGQGIIELEEQKEQLDNELLEVDMEIDAVKQKVVSAQSLTESLTTFGDLYREAAPEERRGLIRLRVNQLIWTPDQIQLGLHDHPDPCQGLVESQQLVAVEGFEPPLRISGPSRPFNANWIVLCQCRQGDLNPDLRVRHRSRFPRELRLSVTPSFCASTPCARFPRSPRPR